MARKDNLIPQAHKFTLDEQSMGGKKCAENRRKRKVLKEQMELLLTLPLTDERAKKQFESMGIDADNMDNQMAMVVKTYAQALKGNINAVNVIREIIGERVVEVNVNNNIDDKVKELQKELEKY